MMSTRTASKLFGGMAASIVLVLTSTAVPADAASKSSTSNGGKVSVAKRDTGWDIP